MKTALIFPGQGSQSVGMLADLYKNFAIVKQTFTNANDVLGYDVWNIIQNEPEKLNQTQYTQIAMLSSSIACLKVLRQETNIIPDLLAGHSLGETTALIAAEVISFDDGLKIISKRAKLMQNAVSKGVGSMAAILGLDDSTIIKACKEYSGNGIVEAVNFNANGQVVIAGNKNSVAETCEILKGLGAKRSLILPVSVPSHSSLMKNAGIEFLEFLQNFTFNMPKIPVIQNIDAEISTNLDQIKLKLSRQLYNPVLWVKTINNLTYNKIQQTIEVGPGKVLSGLNRRIDKNIISKTIFNQKSLEDIQNA